MNSRRPAEDLLIAASPKTRLLAGEVTEIIKPRPTHDAVLHDFQLIDVRAVRCKDSLDADAEANFADREGRADTRATIANHNALEDLDAFFFAFNDLVVHTHGVTDAYWIEILSDLS